MSAQSAEAGGVGQALLESGGESLQVGKGSARAAHVRCCLANAAGAATARCRTVVHGPGAAPQGQRIGHLHHLGSLQTQPFLQPGDVIEP